jgi:hypothetical protein
VPTIFHLQKRGLEEAHALEVGKTLRIGRASTSWTK